MASVYRLASWSLERLAQHLGVEIEKALDPLKPKDFLAIVSRLSSALRSATKGTETEALKSALDTLDVDWPSLSEGQKFRVYIAAKEELKKFKAATALAETVVSRSTIVEASRASAVRTYGLKIPAAFADNGKALSKLMVTSQMVYIKDEYGRRVDAFDQLARKVVASGLENGLGREDIGADLKSEMNKLQVNRSKNYWDLIASDFANKSRTISQIYSMDEAGITEYVFSAVGDEVMCSACGFMDGKSWSVPLIKTQLDYALQLHDPEDIQDVRPFLKAGQINGREVAYYEKYGERFVAAERSGSGFKQLISDSSLFDAGVTICPLHSRCRCTIVSR